MVFEKRCRRVLRIVEPEGIKAVNFVKEIDPWAFLLAH